MSTAQNRAFNRAWTNCNLVEDILAKEQRIAEIMRNIQTLLTKTS
jgi:hypothetical protein